MTSDEIIETMARAGAKAGLEAGGRRYSAKDVAPGTVHHSEALFIIRAALSAAEAAGWVMVPKEPTGEMWLAGRKAFDVEAEKFRAATRYEQASAIADRAPEAIYRAMLAAAGEPE